jgi:hypothetical protein
MRHGEDPTSGPAFLAPAQAQKHVTVNESLYTLDGAVQCAVLEMNRNDPPAAPAEGAQYLVGAAPTGAWGREARSLAAWRNGGWWFSRPKPGWRVYDLASDRLFVLGTGLAWAPLSGAAEVQNATRLGVGMAADAANPFAAKLNAALFTARTPDEGGTGDVFLTANKSAANRDAGHVFQTGFVTRALAGLFGSNRFRIAVSPDGSAFHDALSVNEANGIVDLPRTPRFKAFTNFDNFAALDTWVRIGINTTESNEQGAFNAATNRFTAPVAGVYLFGASLLYRVNTSLAACMRGRLLLNGTTEIRGSFGEVSSAYLSMATALWLQTMTPLAQGDTVELQGYFRSADGFFAANHTTFWGCKIG